MVKIVYDNGKFIITDDEIETSLTGYLSWDEEIEIESDCFPVECEVSDDRVLNVLDETMLCDLHKLYEFIKQLRLNFHTVSCSERANFLKKAVEFL